VTIFMYGFKEFLRSVNTNYQNIKCLSFHGRNQNVSRAFEILEIPISTAAITMKKRCEIYHKKC